MHSVSGVLVSRKGRPLAGWSVAIEFSERVDLATGVLGMADAAKPERPSEAAKPRATTGRARATAGRPALTGMRDEADGAGTAVMSRRVADRTDAEGRFALEVPDPSEVAGASADVTVAHPSGKVALVRAITLDGAQDELKLVVEDAAEPITVEAPADPATLPPARLTGHVFDVTGRAVPSGLQVVLHGGESADSLRPLLITRTESGGYFRADYPTGSFEAAVATVATATDAVPIHTEGGAIPNPMLIGVTLGEAATSGCADCPEGCGGGCGGRGRTSVPRAPGSADLVNSAETYSTDLGTGGCVQFNVPNRSVDEFDFFSVVRTTEPEIRGVTLGGPAGVPGPPARSKGSLLIAKLLSRLAKVRGTTRDEAGTAAELLSAIAALPRIPDDVLQLVREALEDPERIDLESFNEQLRAALGGLVLDARAAAARPAGRAALTAANPVDWDSTPTFYEAATIAHGHLLHFKQVWYADGYSLGDLLYSLPLAPGQKRLIAVLDWERRDQAAREEGTTFSEGLQASLSRDRDVNEVVSGTLSESMRGGSRSETAGIGVGTGAAGNGSYQGFNFGALLGISGGYGSSSASAWQDSARSMGAQSLQQLRDSTLQAASAIRGLRSTVVHSASQGEAVRASTEVVANHNRCHALTVQYFEVLRHLRVELELADVQECLFVPLPMTAFDRPKALRWRESLARHLRARALAGGFDAMQRVESNWADVDVPAGRYADEQVTSIVGEFEMTVLVPLPPIPDPPLPDPTTPANAVADALNPTKSFFGALLAVATGGASALTGAVLSTVSAGASATAEAFQRTEGPQARYEKLHREVMPGVVAGLVNALELWAVVDGTERRIASADFTLVSDYRPGSPLLVSVRAPVNGGVTRGQVTRLMIRSSVGLPEGCRALMNSGILRYRTAGFEHVLVDDRRLNDDIDLPKITVEWIASPIPVPKVTTTMPGSGVALFTPLDLWEQRRPRKEDQRLARELLEHLNDNLEHYHHAVWWEMDPNRRYMLLDGYVAPNADGRSVASVSENRLIGIVGNSLVLPVARGVHLDPRFAPAKDEAPLDLLAYYSPTTPVAPSRVSLPTRGVFAEAVMGACNSCEQIDDTRLWRWEDAPLDEVPAIGTLSTESRRSDAIEAVPSTFPSPVVSIQNIPNAPEPAGVSAVTELLGKASTFPDITGLAATQAASLAAYTKALDTAATFGKEASTLAQQASMTKSIDKSMDAIDKAETSGGISSDDAKSLRLSALRKLVGGEDSMSAEKVKERIKVIDEAASQGSIEKDDAKDLAKKSLDKYVSGDEKAQPEAESAAKKIGEIQPEAVDRVEVSPQRTVVSTRRPARRVSVILTARYANDAIFPAQFDLGVMHESTGKVYPLAFDTAEGTAQAWLENAPSGSYSILGRVLRTVQPDALAASGDVTIAGTTGPFTVTVPFSVDTSRAGFFTPTGNFMIPAGAASIALIAQPTTSARTVEAEITLSAGLNGQAEYSSEVGAKLGGKLEGLVEAGIEGKSGITLTAGGTLSGGQATKFTISYERITGIQIKPRT